jgi:hypothetical protein
VDARDWGVNRVGAVKHSECRPRTRLTLFRFVSNYVVNANLTAFLSNSGNVSTSFEVDLPADSRAGAIKEKS